MFGVSQQSAVNALGMPSQEEELPTSDRSSTVGEVASADFAQRFSTGDFGRESLIEKSLTARNQSLHEMGLLDDPTISYNGPDYQNVLENPPKNAVSAAEIGKYSLVDRQRRQEDKVAEIYKNNPQLPQLSYQDAVTEAQAQAQSLDVQSEAVGRHAGVPTAIAGGLIGGGAATFTPENALQAGGMLLPIPGSTALTRIGALGMQQFGVSLATQAGVVNPSREAMGLSTMTTKEMLEQALVNGVTGSVTQGAFDGAHAGFKHFFPATTPTAASDVVGKMDEVQQLTRTPAAMKTLIDDLKAAQNPDQAAAAMASAPLETQLNLAHSVVENPSEGERAILNAGELELLNEKAQPDGVSWPEHIERRDEVATAIEAGQPIPDGKGALSPAQLYAGSEEGPRLPQGLTNAKPRYRDSEIGFNSDVDKALYITAQDNKSKADAAYRKFLLDNGMDEATITAQGQAIKDAIKAKYDETPGEKLQIEAQTQQQAKPVLTAQRAPSALLRSQPKAPKSSSLLEFLSERGGLKDPGGDLEAMGANDYHKDKNGKTVPFKKKLIREGGLHPDDAALAAYEAGYFPETSGRPTVNDLFDKVDEELRGNKQYAHADSSVLEHQQMLNRMSGELDRAGVSPHMHTDEQIHAALEKYRDEQTALEAADRAREEAESIGAREAAREAAASEVTPAGEQSVIPRAERISDRALAERTMEKPLRSDRAQKPMNDGLFDVGGRSQADLLDNIHSDEMLQKLHEAKETDMAPVSDEKATTIKEALADISEHEGLLKSLTTCFME